MNLKCKHCGKDIAGFDYSRIEAFDGGVRLTVHHECLEDALKEFDNKYLIDLYKGVKIYKFEHEYYDDTKSKYYFESPEDVKECIDNNNVSTKWKLHNNEINMVALNQLLANDEF